jgi:hypothetical protein
MKEHVEALSEAASARADTEAFRESMEGSPCLVGGNVERIYKASVGSSANQSILWVAACICQLFQSVERPEGE